MTPRCKNCEWWSQHFIQDVEGTDPSPSYNGWCQRYPPQVVVPKTYDWGTTTEFPVACADEWCGEFKPKGKTDERQTQDTQET